MLVQAAAHRYASPHGARSRWGWDLGSLPRSPLITHPRPASLLPLHCPLSQHSSAMAAIVCSSAVCKIQGVRASATPASQHKVRIQGGFGKAAGSGGLRGPGHALPSSSHPRPSCRNPCLSRDPPPGNGRLEPPHCPESARAPAPPALQVSVVPRVKAAIAAGAAAVLLSAAPAFAGDLALGAEVFSNNCGE